MYTKAIAFLALASIANGNDVIVGLKTDGRKFFDENRQANPAIWRQMDNVTIQAPENEIIRRVVITDLRPDKDGDVKVVEGGEGHKNVTIELKSPTVLRGYEFHIEVYSAPDDSVPLTNDQQSTTESVQNESTTTISNNPTDNLDTTSNVPDSPTDKIVPAILTNDDQAKDNDRQGRNAKNEENTSDSITESTSTTFKSDVSTTATNQGVESEKTSDTPNKFEHDFTNPLNSINKNINTEHAIPAISGKDIANDKFNANSNDSTRHVRDTETENSAKSADHKFNSSSVRHESSTENDKEATTTEISVEIPVEEKSEDKGKQDGVTIPKTTTFNNHKYTSVIPSKTENPGAPIGIKDDEKLRNVRRTDEHKIDEDVSTTTYTDSTTADINGETTTLTDDCVTTEATKVQNPVNAGNENHEGITGVNPMYLNNRQWDQRFSNPTFQTRDNPSTSGLKVYPAVLTNDQSTYAPETIDAEHLGNNYEPSPDHMENKNPKMTAIASFRDKNLAPVIST